MTTLTTISRLRELDDADSTLPWEVAAAAALNALPALLNIAEAVTNLKREGWFLSFSEDSNVTAINEALTQLEAM